MAFGPTAAAFFAAARAVSGNLALVKRIQLFRLLLLQCFALGLLGEQLLRGRDFGFRHGERPAL